MKMHKAFIFIIFASAPLLQAMSEHSRSEHSMSEAEFKAAWQPTGNPKVDAFIQNNYKDASKSNYLVAPLHWAALLENVDVVRALIDEIHVPADIRDQNGRTALYWANSKDGELIDVLIKRSADVNVRDNLGYTPLEYVTFFTEKMVVAQALLKYGANLDAKDVYGRTPLDYARKHNNEALIKLFEEAEVKQQEQKKKQQILEVALMQADERIGTEIVELRSDYDRWLAGLKQAAAEKIEQKHIVEIKFSKEQQAQEMAAMQAAETVQTQQVQNDTVGGWYTTAPVHEDGYLVKSSTQEMKEVDSPLPEDVLRSFVMIDASSM